MEEKILKEIVIREEEYQQIKQRLNKKDDYFSNKELENLMQFLMQRQRKSIKNEEKRDKTQKWECFKKKLKVACFKNI